MLLALGVSTFTSCSDNDDPSTPEPDPYVPQPVEVSYGAFIINAGSYYSGINGSITSYDYSTNQTAQNVFSTVNGRYLGGTPNDAVIYGTKMYVVSTDEHTVEVVDKTTMRSLGTVKLTETTGGAEKGTQPRHAVAYDGKVFVSTFAGYVAAIDTTSYGVNWVAQAGSYPEGMAVLDGKLYVANSSYGNGVSPSLSEIDLKTYATKTITDEAITNPVALTVVNGTLYILDSGTYDASWNQTGAGVRMYKDGKVTRVADATMMASYSDRLYLINAPYSYPATTPTYTVYDTTTGTSLEFTKNGVDSPAAIGVDPVSGLVYITSYNMDADTGYASYTTDGYANVYNQDGSISKKISTGVGPTAIVFNTGVVYE